MSCTLTTGFNTGCHDNRGGLLELYFGNFVSDLAITQDSTGRVTAISGTSLSFWKYELENETGQFTENFQNNRPNGAEWTDQVINLVINKMEQEKRNEIKLLGRARMVVIAKTQNGDYWLLGQQNGIRRAGGTGGSGSAMGDRNGYDLNFEGKEPDPAPIVDYSAFSALIGS